MHRSHYVTGERKPYLLDLIQKMTNALCARDAKHPNLLARPLLGTLAASERQVLRLQACEHIHTHTHMRGLYYRIPIVFPDEQEDVDEEEEEEEADEADGCVYRMAVAERATCPRNRQHFRTWPTSIECVLRENVRSNVVAVLYICVYMLSYIWLPYVWKPCARYEAMIM